MKKILVINGSPRGEESGTLKVTNAFLEGIKLVNEEADITVIHLRNLNFNTCTACSTCYQVTPGVCKFNDDFTPLLLDTYRTADLVILSFPLQVYGMSTLTQKFLERTYPLLRFSKVDESKDEITLQVKVNRPDNHKFIYISTSSSTNIESVYAGLSKRVEKNYNHEAQTIFCPQTNYPYTEKKINGTNFFKVIQWAGQDVARTGKISDEIQQLIQKFTESTDHFMKLSSEVTEQLFPLTKGFVQNNAGLARTSMPKHSKTFNTCYHRPLNHIIELFLTDHGESYYFKLTSESYEFIDTNESLPSDLKIQMNYDTYKRLINRNLNFIDGILTESITYTGHLKLLIWL
ncbi:MAG: flavodoxin family protein, partial [Turicibacter sp.]